MKRHSRFALWMMALAVVSVPAVTAGDTVKTTDGSVLKGRVIRLDRDTLSVESTFGGVLRIPRSRIVWISFGDSVTTPESGSSQIATVDPTVSTGGDGELGVTFKNRVISSKIVVTKRKDLAGHLHANGIQQFLLVDGDTAFSYVDTVMDKTIYKGPDRVYKNTIELKDMFVNLSPGDHQIFVIVRSVGYDQYEDRFENGPLNVEFLLGDVQVHSARTTLVNIGISTGTLRMGKPRLYKVE